MRIWAGDTFFIVYLLTGLFVADLCVAPARAAAARRRELGAHLV
jgi:hypothetical protein